MTHQMAPNVARELATVQNPVQLGAGKLRDNCGIRQSGHDSDERKMKAFVEHRRFSIHGCLAAPEVKHDAAGEMTLRRANALLKRQGTSSRYSGEMSHDVARGCFLEG